jgi:hypothetical protein
MTGLEPVTLTLATSRSDLLSYIHMERKTGIEPATLCLGSRCSTAEPLPRGAPDRNRTV